MSGCCSSWMMALCVFAVGCLFFTLGCDTQEGDTYYRVAADEGNDLDDSSLFDSGNGPTNQNPSTAGTISGGGDSSKTETITSDEASGSDYDDSSDIEWVEVTQGCPNGDCDQDCYFGEICHFSCSGGNCSQDCHGGSECTLTCEGGNCDQDCYARADCAVSCDGGLCDQECDYQVNSCDLDCNGGFCDQDCYGSDCSTFCLGGFCGL